MIKKQQILDRISQRRKEDGKDKLLLNILEQNSVRELFALIPELNEKANTNINKRDYGGHFTYYLTIDDILFLEFAIIKENFSSHFTDCGLSKLINSYYDQESDSDIGKCFVGKLIRLFVLIEKEEFLLNSMNFDYDNNIWKESETIVDFIKNYKEKEELIKVDY